MNSETHKLMTVSFGCGFAAHLGLIMFMQDWLGLERYLAYATRSWVDIPWIVGLMIFAVAWWCYVSTRMRVAKILREDSDERQG